MARKIWTVKEERQIEKLMETMGPKKIAKIMGEDYEKVKYKVGYIRRKGVKKQDSIWTDELDKYIKENYGKMPITEISKNLDIEYSLVNGRIRTLKAKRTRGTNGTQESKTKRAIAELDGNVELGRKYNIKKLGTRDKFTTNNFTGELIQKCNDFYVFRGLYPESFLKVDFAIGEYNIKELTK